MSLTFKVISKSTFLPRDSKNTAYLQEDNWDDFGFQTLFVLTVYDEQGHSYEIGGLKIGFSGQIGGATSPHLGTEFSALGKKFFSLGNGVEYYQYLKENLPEELAGKLLNALRDIVYDPGILNQANQEQVFGTSLLRNVSLSAITGQFSRVLQGGVVLTPYNFYYKQPRSDKYSAIRLDIQVEPDSKPSSNMHILIGRNGVGKTTLLNNMIKAALSREENSDETGFFINNELEDIVGQSRLKKDYFSRVASVSFSAFDSFSPPKEQNDPTKGICYHYIGLKRSGAEEGRHKEGDDLCQDFVASIGSCLHNPAKKELWLNSIELLEADQNFADMELSRLANTAAHQISVAFDELGKLARGLFSRMSSGHAIVLLTITKLIEKVEEKTLVLLDEPESHLHPPLLAAFTRALSDLLIHRNGVAIIATHSPVVLQEVPKSCVSILRRTRLTTNVDRPEIETFAENVGSLTREVFGLEVSKSGFHDLLKKSVTEGKTYEQILDDYKGQIGFEGKSIVQSLIKSRHEGL